MDIKRKLIDERSQLTEKIEAAFAKADSEKRALTVEERAEIEADETRLEAITGEIAAIEADEEARKRNADRKARQAAEATRKTRNGRRADPDDQESEKVGNPADAFLSDPKKGFKTHREFLSAVIDAGVRTSSGLSLDDQRLRHLTAGSDEARGNSDPAGGFLVPLGFSPELLRVAPEDDPIGALTRKIPMDLPSIKIPARTDKNHTTSVSGGVTVTRRPETVAATASQTTFEQVNLVAHNLMGLSYVTEELMTDSPQSFVAILDIGFRDQFTYALTKERLFGTGVGEYLGMANVNNPCLVSVAKETGQAAATFVYANAVNMRSRCWGYSRAVWVANHDTLPQFAMMNQAVGTGGLPVFQPGSRLGLADSDVAGVFLGRPLVFSEYAQTLGTQGDVILANPTEYLEGTYQPLQSAESIHVRFVNNERVFKFWMRNAGQPWWKSALTPVNSSKTLSPFVVCDAR